MKPRLSLFLMLALAAGGAQAVPADGPALGLLRERAPRLLWVSDAHRSLDEVVSRVRRRHPGKILSADETVEGGRPVYRVRIMNDQGRVRGLRFDGRTGQPLPPPEGRGRRR